MLGCTMIQPVQNPVLVGSSSAAPVSWDESIAHGMSPLDRLVYRSNLLGADPSVTNTGGGNTSSKLTEKDPLTGRPVEVLWVKGSGGDLRTTDRSGFASLRMDRLAELTDHYESLPNKGPGSEAEDRMVELYAHCIFGGNPRPPSIDTALHAFVPFKHVDHTHPNAIIAIAAARHGEQLTREVFGDEIAWIPWQRPGFDLGLKLGRLCRERPKLRGVILGQHGLMNWADDDHECFELTNHLIRRAAEFVARRAGDRKPFGGPICAPLSPGARDALLVELLPWLRGRLSARQSQIATVQYDPLTLDFLCGADAARLAELGTSCPDHFLRTRIKPLYVPWRPERDDTMALRRLLDEGLAAYRRDYTAYYDACRHADSPPMRDPNPTVILIPGVAMIAWGRNKSESRVTAEFYRCAIEVMRGAEAIDEYIALPRQEAFNIEYWALEEAKLKRMPAEKELERKVVVVIGAGSGIGRAAAERLARDGAHVVCADLSASAAEATAADICSMRGRGIGVAGSGPSDCGPAVGVEVNIASRESIRATLAGAVLAYGGVDHIVVTAGVYFPSDAAGRISEDRWRTTFEINVHGAYLVADEARALWESQQLPGSLVLTTSVNAVVAKTGSIAYDTSKAAANHLVRELAMLLAPHVRVNGVAPATVLAGSAMFPRDRVIASLSKYGVAFSELEDTDALREKLARFYAERTLLKAPIEARHQAEAIAFLVSDRAARTTGQILSVDGGLPEAFLR